LKPRSSKIRLRPRPESRGRKPVAPFPWDIERASRLGPAYRPGASNHPHSALRAHALQQYRCYRRSESYAAAQKDLDLAAGRSLAETKGARMSLRTPDVAATGFRLIAGSAALATSVPKGPIYFPQQECGHQNKRVVCTVGRAGRARATARIPKYPAVNRLRARINGPHMRSR
jgi:hypothetical protein